MSMQNNPHALAEAARGSFHWWVDANDNPFPPEKQVLFCYLFIYFQNSLQLIAYGEPMRSRY